MFDYNKKSIVILGSVIISGVISCIIYHKKTYKKPIIKKPIIKKPTTDDGILNLFNDIIKVKPVIKYPMPNIEVINLDDTNVKVNHTKNPKIPKSYTPVIFSLQQTKKVIPKILIPQIIIENETHVPNNVKHNTILKFLNDINNNNINLSKCDTKHNDASSYDDNPIIIMARS
jgi:hypothetical protein